MNKVLFCFLVATHSLHLFSCDLKSLDAALKERHKILCTTLEEKIKSKLTILAQEANALKQSFLWRNINKQLEALQSSPEYSSIKKTRETLTLLDSLENYSLSLHKPELLNTVSSFLESNRSLEPLCRSFLQKERAYLMDNTDEVIIIKTKQVTIFELKKALFQNLEKDTLQMQSLETYKILSKAHQTYLNDKKVKKISSIISKIIELEHEKERLILSDKEYLSLQNKKFLFLAKTNAFLSTNSTSEINQLTLLQLSLLIAPFDILIL